MTNHPNRASVASQDLGGGWTLHRLAGRHMIDGYTDDRMPRTLWIARDPSGDVWPVEWDRASTPAITRQTTAIDTTGGYARLYDRRTDEFCGGVQTRDGRLIMADDLLTHGGADGGCGFLPTGDIAGIVGR